MPQGGALRGAAGRYDVVVAPSLPILSPAALAALAACPGAVVLGPRTGSKTDSLTIPPGLAPGAPPARAASADARISAPVPARIGREGAPARDSEERACRPVTRKGGRAGP